MLLMLLICKKNVDRNLARVLYLFGALYMNMNYAGFWAHIEKIFCKNVKLVTMGRLPLT